VNARIWGVFPVRAKGFRRLSTENPWLQENTPGKREEARRDPAGPQSTAKDKHFSKKKPLRKEWEKGSIVMLGGEGRTSSL